MPRTPWGRRHIIDSPRPAGRRWAGRLRRSGSLARQVLAVRVGRRRGGLAAPGTAIGTTGVVTLAGGPDTGLDPLAGRLTAEPAWSSAEPLTRIIAPMGPVLPPPVLPTAPLTAPTLPGWPAPRNPAGQSAAGSAAFGAGAAGPITVGPGLTGPIVGGPGSVGSGSVGSGPVDAGGAHAVLPGPVPLLPGEPTVARRIRFAAVNACTLGSLVLGMMAIFLSMHGGAGVRWAALCLVGCVTFDGLDGALARRLGVSSPFGAQMDSLADMCSFGIAAPVVVYSAIHATAQTALVAAACVLVAACSAIRLARFNVSPKDGRFFCGVPTTMAAAVLGLAVLIGLRPSGTVAVAAIAVLALAMVSGFPYAKLGRIVKLPPWLWLAPVVGAFLDYRITFAALVALYLASGPLVWLRQRS